MSNVHEVSLWEKYTLSIEVRLPVFPQDIIQLSLRMNKTAIRLKFWSLSLNNKVRCVIRCYGQNQIF